MVMLIRVIAALISSFALFWAGIGVTEWWEHRPHATPQVHWWILHWSPPDSLAAQRDAAAGQGKLCQANVVTLQRAISDQNKALSELTAQGQKAKAAASQAVLQALANQQALQTKLDKLKKAPVGATACERADDAYRTVLETLR